LNSRKNSYELAARAGDEVIVEPEVTALCEHFLGDFYARGVYQGSLMALAYIGLLAYAQVFAQGILSFALGPTAEADSASQALTLLVFSCVVVPLSLYDLNEQVHVQVGMSVLRFVSLGILLVGTLVAMWVDPTYSTSPPREQVPVPWFNVDGFGLMFTTAVFSQLFQHSVPGLVRPLAYHQRQEIPRVFGGALLTTAALYILLGAAAVVYFRQDTRTSINLNFAGYYFGLSETSVLRPVVGLLTTIVVLFPALDTLSVYPLIANTLGNNLHASFSPLSLFARSPPLPESSSAEEHQLARKEQRNRESIFFRLVAALPPIFISLFVSDLTVSLQLAGFAGIVVALVTPALLQIASVSEAERVPVVLNPYRLSGLTDLPWLPYAVLALSATAFAVCAAQFESH